MKRIIAISLPIVALALTGCLLSKKTTVTGNAATGFTTNTVVVVNEANLALDSVILQGATSIAVAPLVSKYPNLVQPLRDAHVALDGIINGGNTNTSQQVIAMLKAQNNPALTEQINLLMQNVSKVEQDLLAKYGVTAAGEITISLARAIDAGLVIGLAGH